MNVAILMMASAWTAGADVAPPPPPAAPAVVAPGPGCSDCGAAPCGGCEAKASFFDKLKGKFAFCGHHKKADCGGCEAQMVVCAPEPVSGCEAPADPCKRKPGFFNKLEAKFAGRHHKKEDCGCTEGCATAAPVGCALPTAPATPAIPADAPKDMPKPAPSKASITVPVAPITPISGSLKLTGTTNPF